MPALVAPTPDTIATWDIEELGVLDGSSPNEQYEGEHNSATRRFRCNWAYRYNVVDYLIGYSITYNDGSGTLQLSRLIPQEYPGVTGWFATKLSKVSGYQFQGYDFNAGINTFTKAEFELLYEQVPYNILPDNEIVSESDRYLEYPAGDPEPAGEYLALPGAGFFYAAQPGSGLTAADGSPLDTKPISANIGKIIPQETFRVAWHRLPFSLWDPGSILYQRIFGTGESDHVPFFGAVNKTEFFGRSPGTCLLTGVKPFRRMSPTGVGWELDIHFEIGFRPAGWNFVYGVAAVVGGGPTKFNGWYMVTTDGVFATEATLGDYKSIYNPRDLTQLFQVN